MTYDGQAHVSLLTYPELRDRLILLDGCVQDLRHDRLAPRLVGLAEAALRCRPQARRELLFLRQRGGAIGRHRRARRAAGRRARDGGRVRPPPPARGRGLEPRCPASPASSPKGAFYAFPNISKTGWKAKALASALLEEAGVATIGGPDFGIHGEGYIRLSYANSAENIARALERMGEFLAARKAA